MNQTDLTMTSPSLTLRRDERPLLGLTIVWHPDAQRIGEQFIATNTDGVVELSRFLPMFRHPAGDGLPLGYGGVSREPLRILRTSSDHIVIQPPESRMVVELNGVEIQGAHQVSPEQITAGAILGLGRAILICLHWMRCLPKKNDIAGLIGVGSAAILLRDQIRQIAVMDFPVLLLGETGTGKEIAARAIHAHSKRRHASLVTVNMAALNESLAAADLFGAVKGAYTGAQQARKGLFGEAAGASLFLDEIGNTPATIQPMLLRVLETGDYRPLGAQQDMHSSARLIAATDQDLYSEHFNQALLRRLESFVIQLPPLRSRREDIGVLLKHLLEEIRAVSLTPLPSLSVPLISAIANYDWPGNIRQLSHVLRRILLALQAGESPDFAALVQPRNGRINEDITAFNVGSVASNTSHVTERTRTAGAAESANDLPVLRKKMNEFCEAEVLQAMDNNDWYIQGAAQELGISRPSMYKLLEQHSAIRRAEQIPLEEIRQTLASSAGDIEACAAILKTPSEALRRFLKVLPVS